MDPLKNFSTPLSGAPQKCFKSGPALANAGPASVELDNVPCAVVKVDVSELASQVEFHIGRTFHVLVDLRFVQTSKDRLRIINCFLRRITVL